MASTFKFNETYGTSPGTSVDTSYVNLLSADTSSGTDATTKPAANPIVVPGSGYSYSYERWIRGHWTGSFTSISNVYFWKQSGDLPTGVKVKALKKATDPTVYVTPVNTASTYAGTDGHEGDTTNDIPTATGSINPAYASNFSDYVVMQLVVGNTAAAGVTSDLVYRFGWDET